MEIDPYFQSKKLFRTYWWPYLDLEIELIRCLDAEKCVLIYIVRAIVYSCPYWIVYPMCLCNTLLDEES